MKPSLENVRECYSGDKISKFWSVLENWQQRGRLFHTLLSIRKGMTSDHRQKNGLVDMDLSVCRSGCFAGPTSSDRQSYRGSERTLTESTQTQQKPRKTVTYVEQLQSLQKPKDSFYNRPSTLAYFTTSYQCRGKNCDKNFLKQAALLNRARQQAHTLFCTNWGLGLHLGYSATPGAKSDVIFLLSDPDFL